ncbi:hypothetical protein ANTQUA_LOCUS5764 [Anthophora quadrimaculata]
MEGAIRRRNEDTAGLKRQGLGATVSARAVTRCYKCGEVGHLSTTCQRLLSWEKGSCFQRGSMGHQVATHAKESLKD